MKEKIKTFLTDNDGVSITDYLCLLLTTIYLIIILATLVFILSYHNLVDFNLKFEKLKILLDVIDDPIKIILSSYFINGFTSIIKKGGNKK